MLDEYRKELLREIKEGLEKLNFSRNYALYLQPGSFTEKETETLLSNVQGLVSFYSSAIELRHSLGKYNERYSFDTDYKELERIIDQLIIDPLSDYFAKLALRGCVPGWHNLFWCSWNHKIDRFFKILIESGYLKED